MLGLGAGGGGSEASPVLQRLFRPRPARQSAALLYQAVTRQARRPDFYTLLGAPDTVEGRFELYSLHVILLLERLRDQGPQLGEVSQALFDAYVRALDDALRDLGVGDLSVGKKMRRLGEAFYGRAKSYQQALVGHGADLEALIVRTVYAGAPNPGAAALTVYVRRCHAVLAQMDQAALLAGEPRWAEITA